MVKLNKKEVISLVKNDFIPLEESKEGLLKGGFGSVIQSVTPPVTTIDNCPCNKNNCNCPDGGCQVEGNNCACGTTTPASTPSIPTDPTRPTDPFTPTTPDPAFPSVTEVGFVF